MGLVQKQAPPTLDAWLDARRGSNAGQLAITDLKSVYRSLRLHLRSPSGVAHKFGAAMRFGVDLSDPEAAELVANIRGLVGSKVRESLEYASTHTESNPRKAQRMRFASMNLIEKYGLEADGFKDVAARAYRASVLASDDRINTELSRMRSASRAEEASARRHTQAVYNGRWTDFSVDAGHAIETVLGSTMAQIAILEGAIFAFYTYVGSTEPTWVPFGALAGYLLVAYNSGKTRLRSPIMFSGGSAGADYW